MFGFDALGMSVGDCRAAKILEVLQLRASDGPLHIPLAKRSPRESRMEWMIRNARIVKVQFNHSGTDNFDDGHDFVTSKNGEAITKGLILTAPRVIRCSMHE